MATKVTNRGANQHEKGPLSELSYVDRLPQIDFIKGIAIFFVILLHAGVGREYYHNFWNGQAVPLFIISTFYLSCNSLSRRSDIDRYFSLPRARKFIHRVFLPFFATQLILVSVYIIESRLSIVSLVRSGGIGPGAYYPWLHLQIWVITPFLFLLMKKWNCVYGAIVVLTFSILMNFVFSTLSGLDGVRENLIALYRLFANRYLFLFVLVYLIMKNKVNFNLVGALAFVSIVYMSVLRHINVDLEPLIYDSGWRMQEFPSHAFSVCVFFSLFYLYSAVPRLVRQCMELVGARSWGIFNVQMVYFSVVPTYLNVSVHIHVIFSLSICLGTVFAIGKSTKIWGRLKRSGPGKLNSEISG